MPALSRDVCISCGADYPTVTKDKVDATKKTKASAKASGAGVTNLGPQFGKLSCILPLSGRSLNENENENERVAQDLGVWPYRGLLAMMGEGMKDTGRSRGQRRLEGLFGSGQCPGRGGEAASFVLPRISTLHTLLVFFTLRLSPLPCHFDVMC